MIEKIKIGGHREECLCEWCDTASIKYNPDVKVATNREIAWKLNEVIDRLNAPSEKDATWAHRCPDNGNNTVRSSYPVPGGKCQYCGLEAPKLVKN